MSFFWTISTSAKEGPLLIEILQQVQKNRWYRNYGAMFNLLLTSDNNPFGVCGSYSNMQIEKGLIDWKGLKKVESDWFDLIWYDEQWSKFTNSNLDETKVIECS